MLEATFVSDGRNLVGRAIGFEDIDLSMLIQKIQSKIVSECNQIDILSINKYNSYDAVTFDILVDFRSNC
jgi:hypothetical protein